MRTLQGEPLANPLIKLREVNVNVFFVVFMKFSLNLGKRMSYREFFFFFFF
jgi:hypothetical protein